ncbi:hypothetical protein FB451DRAFT_1463794 [Mycena latifolia]|nr:hypothetical protein FB451DRAFT_1463794 [Mycena latifolia]
MHHPILEHALPPVVHAHDLSPAHSIAPHRKEDSAQKGLNSVRARVKDSDTKNETDADADAPETDIVFYTYDKRPGAGAGRARGAPRAGGARARPRPVVAIFVRGGRRGLGGGPFGLREAVEPRVLQARRERREAGAEMQAREREEGVHRVARAGQPCAYAYTDACACADGAHVDGLGLDGHAAGDARGGRGDGVGREAADHGACVAVFVSGRTCGGESGGASGGGGVRESGGERAEPGGGEG